MGVDRSMSYSARDSAVQLVRMWPACFAILHLCACHSASNVNANPDSTRDVEDRAEGLDSDDEILTAADAAADEDEVAGGGGTTDASFGADQGSDAKDANSGGYCGDVELVRVPRPFDTTLRARYGDRCSNQAMAIYHNGEPLSGSDLKDALIVDYEFRDPKGRTRRPELSLGFDFGKHPSGPPFDFGVLVHPDVPGVWSVRPLESGAACDARPMSWTRSTPCGIWVTITHDGEDVGLGWPPALALHFAHYFAAGSMYAADLDGDGVSDPWFVYNWDAWPETAGARVEWSPSHPEENPYYSKAPDHPLGLLSVWLPVPTDGATYSVGVHNISASSAPAHATIQVWVDQQLRFEAEKTLRYEDFWEVGDVSWPSGTVTTAVQGDVFRVPWPLWK